MGSLPESGAADHWEAFPLEIACVMIPPGVYTLPHSIYPWGYHCQWREGGNEEDGESNHCQIK
jgi:hypothetical protein